MLKAIRNIDWLMFFSIMPLLAAGLITMKAFGESYDYFFTRQILWIALGILIFFILSFYDWRFLKNSALLLSLYIIGLIFLLMPVLTVEPIRGAQNWVRFFNFSIEPSDPMKLILVLILAKYFSRRHTDIAQVKHIFISAIYVLLPTVIVLLQPDFGSFLILILIWLGMILVSGINKRHLFVIFLLGLLLASIAWFFILHSYQKMRIITFFDPLQDPRGAGYNARQAVIAVGSGRLFGKGIGYGVQSRLGFLPEHETDFIFAAFAEEWGFFGVIPIFIFFGIVIWRILLSAFYSESNFEKFFGIGFSIMLMAHFLIHVGMNIGILPITGISFPFMSYGGSNLLTLFIGLGILMGIKLNSRIIV